jgi:ATP-dependent Clp protease ATP-binding subunit ClpA
MKRTLVIFMILCFLSRTVAFLFETVVVGGFGAVSLFLYCYLNECCSEMSIPQDFNSLNTELNENVFGQDIAIAIVQNVIKGHVQNPNPEKALVLSFHGASGCGKNHVSRIIAKNLYMKGMDSKYTHHLTATHDFPHKNKVPQYQDQLQKFITEKVKQCPKTLFIFDEVDKVPAGLMDTLRPFLEHHHHVGGVDYRKCIFIFLSNTGSELIDKFVINHWRQRNKREDITIKDMEAIINNGAFDSEGGLWHTELISHNLIDFFVPFMPLEKSHIKNNALK